MSNPINHPGGRHFDKDDPKPVPRHDCKTEDRKLPIDRPCSACSAGDYAMEHHSHCPPFREPVVPDPLSQPGQRQDEQAEFERYFLGNWCNYLNPFWRYPQSGDYVDQFVRGHYTTWQRARSSPPESTGIAPHSSVVYTDLKVRCHECDQAVIWRYLDDDDKDEIEILHECVGAGPATGVKSAAPMCKVCGEPCCSAHNPKVGIKSKEGSDGKSEAVSDIGGDLAGAGDNRYNRADSRPVALALLEGAAQSVPVPKLPDPDGYAYRYPDGIRFGTYSRSVNGSDPLETVAFYYANTVREYASSSNAATERTQWITAINTELSQLREWANREFQRAEAAEAKVSALEGQLRLKEGAIKAQAEREDDAGERCGVDYEKAGCDWPDAVAEEVLVLRGQLREARAKVAELQQQIDNDYRDETIKALRESHWCWTKRALEAGAQAQRERDVFRLRALSAESLHGIRHSKEDREFIAAQRAALADPGKG